MGKLVEAMRERIMAVVQPMLPEYPKAVADSKPMGLVLDRLPCGCSAVPAWANPMRCDSAWAMSFSKSQGLTSDSPVKYREKFADLSVQLDKMIQDMESGILSVADATELFNRKEMGRILSLDLHDKFPDNVRRFVRDNVKLIKSVKSYSLGRMEKLVTDSASGQLRVEDIATEIESTFGVTTARANLIARDQVLKLNSNLAQNRQIAAGITTYIWTSSRDERVRGRPGGKYANSSGDHWSLDGKVFSWMNAPIVDPKSGRQAHPGQDFQCRCTASPDTDSILYGESPQEI